MIRVHSGNLFNFIRLAAVGGAIALATAACGSDDDGSSPAAGGSSGTGGAGGSGGMAGSGGAGSVAKLRVVHAAPGAPAVDLYAAGTTTTLAENLAYGSSTPYLELPPGTYKIDVRAAGSPATDAPVYTTPDVTVAADKQYTAIAAGDIGSTSADDQFRVIPLEEDFGTAGSGTARVRVVHAGFDAPTVGIDVGNDDPSAPEVAALDRFADTGAAGVELPAGAALQVGVVAAGASVTAFTTPTLPDGADLFVVATGELGKLSREDTGFALLAVLPDSSTAWIRQNPRVFALHASPDAGPVDIYAGDQELVDNASFGDMAEARVPPGSYTLDFFPGQAGATPKPSGAPAATATTPALEAGKDYLAIAAGELTQSPSTFQLIALEEGFALDDTSNSRVRVVHASGNAPAVDVGTVSTAGTLDTPALLSNVKFGDASPAEGLSIPPGSLTIGAAATGTTTTAAEFDVTTIAGLRAFAVAAGDLGGTSNPFQLLIVNTTASQWAVVPIAAK
ncbi:MAG: DUF4397 domain-containing protein [Polyangiaceae bacterium]|nr:DUF4397 domain-containing protein [Polyangiaceae bacterium]